MWCYLSIMSLSWEQCHILAVSFCNLLPGVLWSHCLSLSCLSFPFRLAISRIDLGLCSSWHRLPSLSISFSLG